MLTRHGRYAYSPITERPTWRWPNGAGLALYVALGIEEYAFGEGMTEDLLAGVPQPDLVNTAWRDYGNRVGGFRLLDRFRTLGIRPAILLNTALYEHAPQIVRAARAAGAEMVAHGRSNSDSLSGLAPAAEAAYLRAVADRITTEEGAPPRGWSSPWLTHTPSTIDLLAGAGYRYLLDFGMDDQPVWLNSEGGPLLAIPYAPELNDSTTMIGRQASAGDFADMIVDEFDELVEEACDRPLVMSIVVHSFISGRPFRLRALTRALQHVLARREQIWLARPGEIADFITASPGRGA